MQRRWIVLLVLIVVLSLGTTARAQDAGPREVISNDGLIVQVPAGWQVTSYGLSGFLTLSNHERPGNLNLAPGEITADLSYELPAVRRDRPDDFQLPSLQGLLESRALEFSNAGGRVSLLDSVQIPPCVEAARMRGRFGDDYVEIFSFYYADLAFSLRAQTGDADLSAYRDALYGVLGSLRFDTEPSPICPTGTAATPAPTENATAAPPTPPAAEEDSPTPPAIDAPRQVWLRNIERSTGENSIGTLDEVVILQADNEVLVSDSTTAAYLDLETGTYLDRVRGATPDYRTHLFLQFGPDDILYGWDVDGNLVKLRRDLSVLQVLSAGGPALSLPRSMAFARNGNLILYGVGAEDGTALLLEYDTSGLLQNRIELREAVQNTLFTSAAVLPREDGTFLYVDAELNSRLLSPVGDVLARDILELPSTSNSPGFVAPTVLAHPSGFWVVLSALGLAIYDEDGTLRYFWGDVVPEDATTPFSAGQIPVRGDIALTEDGRLVLVGANRAYSVVTLFDIAALLDS